MENENISLEVKNIKKSYFGSMALNNVSFKLESGRVHALVGENGAGKSTLVNIIAGVCQADSGSISMHGEVIQCRTPLEAKEHGIEYVHQELSVFSHLTVAENIFIGKLPQKFGFIRRKKMNKEAERIVAPLNEKINGSTCLGHLSAADQQVVEIAKALAADCKVVIFDEPTSSLMEDEVEGLFKLIEEIKLRGISVIYISHRMSEIFRICDQVSVLRDGEMLGTYDVDQMNEETIIKMMIGKDVNTFYADKNKNFADEVFEVRDFSNEKEFIDISFSLRKGEILGLTGMIGSGRTELARAICGIDKAKKGRVYINGRETKTKNYQDAIRSGFCYMTEDRKNDGLFLEMSVVDNLIVAHRKELTKVGFLQGAEAVKLANAYKEKLNIKFSHSKQDVIYLSGGNQQKIMIAKWLLLNPLVIIMDEPTRGVDVGAKAEIYRTLKALSKEGVGVIVISSDLPEIIGLCTRVIVMKEGRKVTELQDDEINEEQIIKFASFNQETN